MASRPLIAITMGDAAGIGPEIILKALYSREVYELCVPLVIGSGDVLAGVARDMGLRARIWSLDQVALAEGKVGEVEVLDLRNLDWRDVAVGQVCAASGRAAVQYIEEAVRLAQCGEVVAVVTAPINKEATRQAGYEELGHMELFSRLTGVKQIATMLVAGPLRVVHLTTHKPLRDACGLVTKEAVLDKLKLAHRCFEEWGISAPRIGVAALNPHGGEGGILGEEEAREIAPAVAAARAAGIDAQGPYPADSIFVRALGGEFDVVLAMYHDQGHIPIKTYSFEESASVALGLPFIRTSVDHGTALDIAGKGIASPQSLGEAIRVAVSLATGRGLTPA